MPNQQYHPKAAKLGSFLRAKRESLLPEAIGINIQLARRRTPGLRRDEVAEMAGISADWYTRLEQGRSHAPSMATIKAVAAALQLTLPERRVLFRLAGIDFMEPFVKESVPGSLVSMVEAINIPAFIIGKRWDVLAWNEAADAIFGFGDIAEEDRNMLSYMMTGDARKLFGSTWAVEARRMIAQFRATAAHEIDPETLSAFVAGIAGRSKEFLILWNKGKGLGSSSGSRKFQRDTAQPARFALSGFSVMEQPDLSLKMLNPIP